MSSKSKQNESILNVISEAVKASTLSSTLNVNGSVSNYVKNNIEKIVMLSFGIGKRNVGYTGRQEYYVIRERGYASMMMIAVRDLAVAQAHEEFEKRKEAFYKKFESTIKSKAFKEELICEYTSAYSRFLEEALNDEIAGNKIDDIVDVEAFSKHIAQAAEIMNSDQLSALIDEAKRRCVESDERQRSAK